jgi:hypothetical protein
MKRIFWDLECGRTKKDTESWPQYQTSCGISVACVMGEGDSEVEFYTPGDKEPFDLYGLVKRLEGADEVVSFNGDRFDSQVLVSTLGLPALRIARSVDLLRLVLAAKGGVRYPEGSWKLDSICKRTLGEGKLLGDGAFAPQKAREGRWAELFVYCLGDVKLTRDLYRQIASRGYIIDPDGRRMEVRIDG